MNGRNIIILATALFLVFLLVYPSVYISAECDGYLKHIEEIKAAVRNRDDALARELFEEKLAAWEENNTLILAFTPHAETETIKDSIVKLNHSLQRREYALALERADLLYSQINHLADGSCLSWENIF